MTTNNKTHLIQTDFYNCAQVLAKIDELSKLFLKTHRKGAQCELVYSLGGDKKNPIHALAVWHDGSPEQNKEIEFFTNNL